MLGMEDPGQRHEELVQTLIVRLLKTYFFLLIQKVVGPGPLMPPPLYDPLPSSVQLSTKV